MMNSLRTEKARFSKLKILKKARYVNGDGAINTEYLKSAERAS